MSQILGYMTKMSQSEVWMMRSHVRVTEITPRNGLVVQYCNVSFDMSLTVALDRSPIFYCLRCIARENVALVTSPEHLRRVRCTVLCLRVRDGT